MDSHKDNNDYDYSEILKQLNSGKNPVLLDTKSDASDQVHGLSSSNRSATEDYRSGRVLGAYQARAGSQDY